MAVIYDDIDRFLKFVTVQKRFSENTVTAYKNDLDQLADFVSGKSIRSWSQLNQQGLMEYILLLRERSYATSTMARKVAAIKSFFSYLLSQNDIDHDPTDGITRPQVKKSAPKAISQRDVDMLLKQVQVSVTPEGKRDRAMLELLCATGLRVTELVSLDVADVNLDVGRLRCAGKAGKERYLDFNLNVADIIGDYTRNGRTILARSARQAALFLNRRGDRLTRQGFWLILKDYAKKAKLSTEITPHTLRHSIAVHTLNNGKMNLKELQEFLGHANLSTTQAYEKAIITD